MASPFPFTHYACPCSDLTSSPVPPPSKRAPIQPTAVHLDQDRAFNPHDPRASYLLHGIDELLYCDECDTISCPRCWSEEALYWYCPSCLFEVPSSAVRGDGNRCSRSCYSCPSCTSPLAITAVPQLRPQQQNDGLLSPASVAEGAEVYIMQCQFCHWSSLDIGVQFSKATKITEQLTKQRKAGLSQPGKGEDAEESRLDHDTMFANLTAFYRDQLSESVDSQNPFSSSPYSSPANLARIMSLYGGLSYNALKKSREKPQPMREALGRDDGLVSHTQDSDADEQDAIRELETVGWDGTASIAQRHSAPINTHARFTSQLWPIATPLRTKRGRRCRTCRQFLARPEPKVSSMRYRIRLLALNFIPRLSMKPLHATQPPSNPSFNLRPEIPEQPTLKPFQVGQYILTVRNPIEETVKVTLATPAKTPGRVVSTVTILCPSFTVGPAGDVWDEALSSASQPLAAASDGSRRAAMASLTGSSADYADRQPEAGKVWERTRNSTSVVLEIVPGSPTAASQQQQQSVLDVAEPGPHEGAEAVASEPEPEREDDDVLEVPVFVRVEWEAEVKPGESSMGKREVERQAGEKVRKELGYWVVLGVGKIAA